MPPHAQQFAGDPHGDAAERKAFDDSRRNFIALVFCLMVGTASLPHVLTRFYTTPSVARRAPRWPGRCCSSLLLYVTAPALAVLIKVEVFDTLVGTRFDQLPAWINNWAHVDSRSLQVADINRDGIVQLGEIEDRRRHRGAGHARDRAGCHTSSRAWSPPAAWPRRCPPPTACC